jgi:hypothetical protein
LSSTTNGAGLENKRQPLTGYPEVSASHWICIASLKSDIACPTLEIAGPVDLNTCALGILSPNVVQMARTYMVYGVLGFSPCTTCVSPVFVEKSFAGCRSFEL